MKIGELANEVDIGIEAIRFYEKEGLIEKAPRNSKSNYRDYSPSVVQRLLFIKNAKSLGFTLSEIKELLKLKIRPNSKCASVKKRAVAKLDSINEKIRQLDQIKTSLEKLVANCDESLPTSDCPILEAMTEGSK